MGMIQIRGADVCRCFNKRFAAQGQENRFFSVLFLLPMRRIQRCNHATCRWGLAKLQSAWTSVLELPTLLVMQRVDWAQSLDTDPSSPHHHHRELSSDQTCYSAPVTQFSNVLSLQIARELIPAIQKLPSEFTAWWFWLTWATPVNWISSESDGENSV